LSFTLMPFFDLGTSAQATEFFARIVLVKPSEQARSIHRQNLQKDFAVPLRIVRCGHEQTENCCPTKDERLTTPPFPQAGQRLRIISLPLFVRLFRAQCER